MMIRTVMVRLLCGGLILLASSIATDAMAQSSTFAYTTSNLSEVSLAPGDMIRLTFWREPQMNGDYPVDESGRVVLPILGARYVTTASSVDLIDRLVEDYALHLKNQDVNISFLRRVRILGSVHQPGIYHINPTMTLADALALAGGATNDGKLNGIRVLREGITVRTNLEDKNLIASHIQSGDQIFVPERSWFSRHSRIVVGGVLSAATLIVTQALIGR